MATPSKPKIDLADAAFFNLTRAAAVLTLLMMAGIIVSLFYGSWPSIKKFGFSFLWTSRLESADGASSAR